MLIFRRTNSIITSVFVNLEIYTVIIKRELLIMSLVLFEIYRGL